MSRYLTLTLSCALAVVVSATSLWADGGEGNGGDGANQWNRKLKPVEKLIDQGDYQAAIKALDALHQEDPENADVLNLRGFSYRKMGDVDNALSNYQAALELEPKHRGANEYLGQLYLETDQLGKAEERLAVLDKACFFGCKQYSQLKKSIKAYKQDNGIN